MKVIKICNKIGYILIGLLLVVLAAVKIPELFSCQTFAILSGSMEPEIPTGSVVYVRSAAFEELTQGDCITFRLGTDTQLTATHRIISIDQTAKEITTKGDANLSEDVMKVRENMLIGKVVHSLPVVGYGAWFLQSTAGIIYCIVAFLLALLPAGTYKNKRVSGEEAEKTDGKPKKKKTNTLLNILVVVILLVMLLLVWELAKVMMGYAQSRKEYEELRDVAVIPILTLDTEPDRETSKVPEATGDAQHTQQSDTTQTDAAAQGSAPPGEEADKSVRSCPITVDFEALWKTNKDIVGWIYVQSLDISYPMVQAGDNDKYLYTSVKGTYNSAGSIFVDAWNHAEFQDPHTIVYGHNMKNGSMFGSLKKLKNQQTVDQFAKDESGTLGFWIITPKEQYFYEIFSIHTVAAVGDTYALFSHSDQQFVDFINKMAKGTGIKLPQREYTETDKVVTLSTCTGNDAYRLVVQGIRASH